MGKSRITLREIAEAIGVTTATVSLALRNHPRISESRRKLIQAKARELGYRPEPMLAALAHYRKGRSTKPIKAALAWLNFYAEPKELRSYREFDLYWHGAKKAAEKLGFHLEEFVINEELTMSRLEEVLLTRNIQGIFIPPGPLPDVCKDFGWEHFSLVSLSRPRRQLITHSVTPHQLANTLLACEKIREKGYQRIGFVGGVWRIRLFGAGYLWAQSSVPIDNPEMGVPRHLRLPPLLFWDSRAEKDAENERTFLAWLKKTKPDAVLFDILDVPAWLKKAGYRVPGDIGLATTSVLDSHVDAGIYQNPEEVGRVGVLVLTSLIHDNDCGIPSLPREVLLKGKWVDGSSLPDRV